MVSIVQIVAVNFCRRNILYVNRHMNQLILNCVYLVRSSYCFAILLKFQVNGSVYIPNRTTINNNFAETAKKKNSIKKRLSAKSVK